MEESVPPKELLAAASCRELTYEDLHFKVEPKQLAFTTTAEMESDGEWFGQDRALAALELGLRIPHAGYNIYVCGLGGTHRERELATLLRRLANGRETPGDRVLVYNFRNPDRPRALYLPAGSGRRLKKDMHDLVDELRRILPKTFRDETFEEEKEKLSEQFGGQGEEINRKLAQEAERAGFAIQPGPNGEILFIPLKDGEPMKPEDLEKLGPEGREELRHRQRELARQMKAVMRQQQTLLHRLGREVREAERRVASDVVTPLIEEIAKQHPQDDVRGYLNDVREHILDHLHVFQDQPPQPMPLPFMLPAMQEEPLFKYSVNVLVDNGDREGPPVVVESWPTYKNLFGAVERLIDPHGRLVTNFTRIVGGSLLQAHGGCLIVNLYDALSEPLTWRAMKDCLKREELEIEAYDPLGLFGTTTLKPEPMRIQTRVVLTGPAYLFQMLYFVDEDFREIFKVRADFDIETRGEEAQRNFVAQVARLAKSEKLPPFGADAIARLLEEAARSVGDRRKLPAQWDDLADIMREAAFWAAKENGAEVGAGAVQRAIEQRTFRLNRIETRIREMIHDRTLLVDVDGSRIGQVNGLAVLNLAGYEFGRPSRITAIVSLGAHGVVAVDREAKLSGKTYDKAVLIVTGYLRHKYAQEFPLSLSASVSFEQSYSDIDGDSASAAELFAIVSALSEAPLRQDIAVTGSVNQFGEIQPIGGVNEKVEGFFHVCREVGLTGRQGVMIPVQNIDHLVLSRKVMDSIQKGEFHVYPIRTLDEGLELLTGVQAGDVHAQGTIHHRASERLRRFADIMRQAGEKKEEAPKTA
jgi:lon-related putative ATP-dependent protease